jgi:hypothetical protein
VFPPIAVKRTQRGYKAFSERKGSNVRRDVKAYKARKLAAGGFRQGVYLTVEAFATRVLRRFRDNPYARRFRG